MAVESSRRAQSKPRGKKRSAEPKEGGSGKKLVSVLPYALAGVLLIGYFVWMCNEMSTEAPGGGAIPLSIFGAVLLGVLAGGASMIKSRGDK